MVGLLVVGIVLLLVVGIGMLVGNSVMEKAVHRDALQESTQGNHDAGHRSA
ncbi:MULTISPECIES: hypothetical protein [Alicyclobacillus]|uniref:Uncharacterized protein n=1 Tax=Alicyclobacillus acidoterrestris (strain ATCC 49025 / DSM 3922 / CIP 106132 / NCIMB 13137 / GD3B) TaxID=1356854 RepID=T0D1W4_ALIAG|nr:MULTISPECIES: hypothetical protein [Alicyclobacillus]EPZ45522.1 hypothetical protein N007_08750 [Alicyclobacillus acidoterrestris ATCC 49025]UNO49496.1 hypothetical protein K1I37_02785 [Alicyclobacillus acidoterrestris]